MPQKPSVQPVQPGMTLIEAVMTLLDYLRDERLVDSISYARNGRCITCQFSLCPFAGNCPLSRDRRLACSHLCALAQEALAQAGHSVRVMPAIPTGQAAQVAFYIHSMPPRNEGGFYE